MAYTIEFSNKVLKALIRINEPNYSAIKKQIYDLAENLRPQGYRKLKGREGYRIRVGDYRIIYEIFDTILLIEVIDLGHRKEIYEKGLHVDLVIRLNKLPKKLLNHHQVTTTDIRIIKTSQYFERIVGIFFA
jgi:mRNA interferase RelE/StbE